MNKLSISFSRLSTKILGNLAYRSIDIANKISDESVTNNPLLKKLKTTHDKYDEVIIKPLSSGMGKDVIKADEYRDNIYQAVKSIVDGSARLSGSKGEAGRALLKLFDEVGSISSKSYGDESEIIKKLVSLLSADTTKAHIATLAIADEVAEIEKAENNFHQIYIQQAKANASIYQQGSATKLRNDLETSLRVYYGLVWAMKEVSPWDKLYAELAELIKAAKNTIGKSDDTIDEAPKAE